MINHSANLATLARNAPADVVNAIRQASTTTGVDFGYLLQTAAAESSFDPQAQAGTSSARGLYQFIDSTWLDTLDKHGANYGLNAIAEAITRDGNGAAVVSDAGIRREILALRDNPMVSALMAAELAKDNQSSLEQKLGRSVGNAELAMAHFLGAGGAAKFLDALAANPDAQAANLLPAAAKANQAVFYSNGAAQTADQLFARIAGAFDAPAPPVTRPVEPGQALPARAAATATIAAFAPQATLYHHRDNAQLQSLSMLAMTLLDSLSIPGAATDSNASNEWIV